MRPDELSHIEHDALEGYALPCEDTLRLVLYVRLTPRQREVAQLVARGLNVKQIARALGVCDRRVRYLITSIGKAWGLDPSLSYVTQITQRVIKAA